MQVKELKTEGLSCELEVTVPARDIDTHRDRKLIEAGKTLKHPGFRPGKAPLAILRQRYGKAILGEVLETLVNESTGKVIEQRKLRPALQPKIEVKSFDEGKDLVYTVAIESLPEFKVMELKTISLEKPVSTVDDKAVDEALDRIAKGNRETETVTEKRAAKKGDIVVIDFRGKSGGKEYPGMHGQGHHLELGSNQFIAGFEDQLIGKKAGDSVTVTVTFPDPYHMDELSGKEGVFAVDIKEIRVARPAKIDDEFAKKCGMENLQALRDTARKQLQNEYDNVSRLKLKRTLLDALDEGHDFPVPQGMLDLEYDSILRQIEMEREAEAGKGKAKIDEDEKEELKAIAGRRVRLGLILAEIGRGANIKISDQEMQRAVVNEARKYPGREAEVFELFRKNRQALESLRAPLFEDKTVDYILELADVTTSPVPAEDLMKEDEESYTERKAGKKAAGKAAKADTGKEKSSGGDQPKKKKTAGK